MRILIFGGHGMAGHMSKAYFSHLKRYDVWCTSREISPDLKTITFDVTDRHSLEPLLQVNCPQIVINAIGILNDAADDRLQESICVNSWFPHQLARYGDQYGFKVIHISTDCVFSGDRGNYAESDHPDGTSIYAQTKSLGELNDSKHLTIRTSIIGPELKTDGIGLFHWFMSQSGEIPGFRQVFWNGVTTLELAKAIEWAIQNNTTGLVHLAAKEKISKYDLLQYLKQVFLRDGIRITPCDNIRSDKSLINTREDFSFPVASYPLMLRELKYWMDKQEFGSETNEA